MNHTCRMLSAMLFTFARASGSTGTATSLSLGTVLVDVRMVTEEASLSPFFLPSLSFSRSLSFDSLFPFVLLDVRAALLLALSRSRSLSELELSS